MGDCESEKRRSLWERVKWWWWGKVGRKRAGRRISKAIDNGSFFKIAEEENYTIYAERNPDNEEIT